MRIALLHLRTSLARWAVLPLALLGLLMLFQRSTFWVGIWPEAGAAVASAAFFLSLFSAGLSAWASARTDVYRMREQTAAAVRRPGLLELLRFAANLFWLLLAYAAVVATASLVSASGGAPGVGFYIGYTLLGLFLVVMAAAWGWMFGRLMSPSFAAATAFFSWFLFASLVGPVVDANPVSGPPWISVDIGAIAVRLTVLAAFCLAVCLAPSRDADRAWGVAAIGVMLTALVATLLSTSVLGARAPVAAPLCLDRTITYCLWPEHQKYVPLVDAVDAQVAALPLDLRLPEKIVDYSLSGSRAWGADGIERELEGTFDPEFDISEGSRWALARGVAVAITSEVFAACELGAPVDPELGQDQLLAWLEYRLAGGGSPDYTTNAPDRLQEAWESARTAARDLDDSQQGAWASEVIRTTTSYCHVS